MYINQELLNSMAQKKKTTVENPQELENFENAVLSSEAFIEKNQKPFIDSSCSLFNYGINNRPYYQIAQNKNT